MTDTPPDPVDQFLDGGGTPCAGADALRQILRGQTTRVLRRRRRLKRAALATVFALPYAVIVALLWTRAAPEAPAPPPGPVTQAAPDKQSAPPIAQPEQPRSAAQYEQAALREPARRAAHLRRAGDAYLQDEADYAAALRCYTQSLDAGGAEALQFSTDDTWLVMALKDARRKERAHAHGE